MKLKSKLLLALLATSSAAFAQTAPAAPESALTFNVGVVSEYRYRGLGQTRGKPALQGGLDYAHSSGAYIGAWGSTINWIKDTGTDLDPVNGSVEIDLYAGYKFEAAGLGFDVGYLRYEYSGNTLEKANLNLNNGTPSFKNPNTDEIYAAVTAGPVTAKYSYSLGNLFGAYNFTNDKKTTGSTYLDLSATFDLGDGLTFVPHVGRQQIKNADPATGLNFSYTDFALTLNKDFGNGLSASLSGITTNADKTLNTNMTVPPGGSAPLKYYSGKSTLVAGVKYSF